jgi:hypothetical protein
MYSIYKVYWIDLNDMSEHHTCYYFDKEEADKRMKEVMAELNKDSSGKENWYSGIKEIPVIGNPKVNKIV